MVKKTVLYLCSAASLCFGLFGQEADINPFAPPPPQGNGVVEAPVAPTSLDSFQFNGLMVMNGKVRISIFDAKGNKSFWIREGQLGEYGVSFQRFDEENETVVIAQGGITKKLSLNKVKIEPLKISAPRAAPALTAAASPSVSRAPTKSSVESDEEARARIQRVAEEIRRRRAERRQQLEDRSGAATN